MKLLTFLLYAVAISGLTACDRLLSPTTDTVVPGTQGDLVPPTVPPALLIEDLPPLAAMLTAGPADQALRTGGSIDLFTMSEDGTSITFSGWALIKAEEPEPTLSVYAPDAIRVTSINRVERPDVSQALNDESLRFSGFTLSLSLTAGSDLSTICITTRDGSYGERLISNPTDQSLNCTITTLNE